MAAGTPRYESIDAGEEVLSSVKTANSAQKKSTTRTPAQRARRSEQRADQRAELKALKELVLLQKTKQALLGERKIDGDDLDILLDDYLKVILNLTKTEAGSVLLRKGEELVFRASRGPGSKKLVGKRMPDREGIAGWVVRNGRTYLSPDVLKDIQWSSRISAELHFETKNILASPLGTGEDVMGVVEIINKKDSRPFDRDDQDMLESLAGQLAMDIAYAKYLSASIRQADRRAMQMQLATVLNSTLDQREVRKRAMEAATSLMDAEVGSLLLVDEKTKELFFEVALGDQGERLSQVRLKMGEGIAGWVAANDHPALVNDVQGDPRHLKKVSTITNFVTRNMVCVPVRSKGRVIGVLQAINKKDNGQFTEEDLEDFAALADQVAVALENAHLYSELQETFLNTAEALAAAVEKKDPYTGGHIVRVLKYSTAIARHMDMPLSELEQLRLAAVLHDIGKIGIKDSVLLKQGRLDVEELAHMREHPLVGDDILGHIEQMKEVRKIMRSHHEKWDGSGYPDGLKEKEIPVHARIIAIADALDAITTDRPYRKAADLPAAVEEIRRFSGKEFDPDVVNAFLKACESGEISIVR